MSDRKWLLMALTIIVSTGYVALVVRFYFNSQGSPTNTPYYERTLQNVVEYRRLHGALPPDLATVDPDRKAAQNGVSYSASSRRVAITYDRPDLRLVGWEYYLTFGKTGGSGNVLVGECRDFE
jgi:hypothetical protein